MPALQIEKKLLMVGLGNPGAEYQNTRHNMGFSLIDAFCSEAGSRIQREAWQPEEGILSRMLPEKPGESSPLFLKPMSYMNASGIPVAETIRKYGISPRNLLVISDDLDMPLGKIRLRLQGSPGGHRGLLSIAQSLETEDFPRLRLGIGRPRAGTESIVDWVLGHRSSDEEVIFQSVMNHCRELLKQALAEGLVPQTWSCISESDNIHAEC